MDTFRTEAQTKSWRMKTTVEQCLSLPIGIFKDAISGGALEWRSCESGKALFSVSHLADKLSHPNDPYLRLRHPNQHLFARGETVTYRVQLVATEPLEGGQRWCFLCPGPFEGKPCDRIVRKLYLPDWGTQFACRRCYKLCYRTQRQNARHRALSRAQAIRRRLGGSGSVHEPIPDKPARMRWKTYDRLREKAIEAERHYFGAAGRNSEVVQEPQTTAGGDAAMPPLPNSRQESFAQHLARGLNGSKAYVAAGYTGKGAKQSASRLRTNPAVAARVMELRRRRSAAAVEEAVAQKIATSNPGRLQELQVQRQRIRDAVHCVLVERGTALAHETAGGSTGLLRKRLKGGHPVYFVDRGVPKSIRQLLALERRAADEVADWAGRYECHPIDHTSSASEDEICLALWADITAQNSKGHERPEDESPASHVSPWVSIPAEPTQELETPLESPLVSVVVLEPTDRAPAAVDELAVGNIVDKQRHCPPTIRARSTHQKQALQHGRCDADDTSTTLVYAEVATLRG